MACIFDAADFADHEEVVFCRDASAGLKAIIAIHSTARGPALGGCRIHLYPDEQAAITDVLRLARGMTYKAAMADLPFGGGKAVIIADPKRDKNERLLTAFGRAVERLGGRYITAEDSGSTVADMEIVRRATRHVVGTSSESGGAGDPSPATAWGVFHGIRAAAHHRLRRDDIAGLRIAVQGLGAVGRHLCRHLREAGAELVVADLDPTAVRRIVEEFGATAVAPEAVYDQNVDVFAPCALGAVLNDDTVPRLKASIVAGAANNQLARPEHGRALAARDILYAPDYVINAGGIIHIAHEGPSYDRAAAFRHVARIYDTLLAVFARADQEKVATSDAADRIAAQRIAAAGSNRRAA
jgi:leucine dehydrogenase